MNRDNNIKNRNKIMSSTNKKNRPKTQSKNRRNEEYESWDLPIKPRNPVRQEQQRRSHQVQKRYPKSKTGKGADRPSNRSRDINEPQYKNMRVYRQRALNESQTKVKNERRMKFYFGIVAFIILLYFGSNIYRMIAESNVKTMQLSKVVIDTPKVYDSLIVRTERVVKSNAVGEVDYKLTNNEKAGAGDLVANVIDETFETEDLVLSSEEFTESSNIANAEVESINSRIKSEFSYSKINDYSEAYIYAEKIYQSIEMRNQIISVNLNNVDANSNIQSSVKESLFALNSGIVSYNLDSFEDAYSPENLEEITIDDIKNVIKASQPVRNKVVTVGENVFKVIEDNLWYLVTYVDNEEIQSRNIEVGAKMVIYISKANTFLPVETEIHSIDEGNKTTKVVFKCYSYVSEFSDLRAVSIKLAKENVEGYKVPRTAILEKEAVAINKDFVLFNEDEAYEYVIKVGYDGNKYVVPINKYSSSGNRIYVLKDTTDLNKGDVLMNEDIKYQIPDVYVIKGVYVLNTGIATYKEVFPSNNSLDDSSLVFLEQNNNSNVRIHDTIAVDVLEISENEIIY